MIKQFFIKMWEDACNTNFSNIFTLCEKNNKAKVLDLGSGDGSWTLQLKKAIGTKKLYAVEMDNNYIKKLKEKGIEVVKSDLNKKLPFDDNTFDVIHSNQVIEHLIKIDLFVSEIYRILRPGGYAIISTENLSSWHNIFATILGWQPFSHHISKRFHLGNPLSPHAGKEYGAEMYEGARHNIVMTMYSLKQFFKAYKFKIEEAKGAGYYPLPGVFSKIDPYHSHFITIKIRKIK